MRNISKKPQIKTVLLATAFLAFPLTVFADDFGSRFDNTSPPGLENPTAQNLQNIEPAAGPGQYDAQERFEDTLPSSKFIDAPGEETFEDTGQRHLEAENFPLDKSVLYETDIGP